MRSNSEQDRSHVLVIPASSKQVAATVITNPGTISGSIHKTWRANNEEDKRGKLKIKEKFASLLNPELLVDEEVAVAAPVENRRKN